VCDNLFDELISYVVKPDDNITSTMPLLSISSKTSADRVEATLGVQVPDTAIGKFVSNF
jgi:hypothetical protein